MIVGAGLAGLVAARRLVQAGASSLTILEARPRVGGRLLNEDIDEGKVVELGGQWIGPNQRRLAMVPGHDLPGFDGSCNRLSFVRLAFNRGE